MNKLAIERTPSACEPPLTIGRILAHGVAKAPRQEIVYGNLRFTYSELAGRVRRLASGLAQGEMIAGLVAHGQQLDRGH